jgi:hypothetical protein
VLGWDEKDDIHCYSSIFSPSVDEPATPAEADTSPEWADAMVKELNSLEENQTFQVVKLDDQDDTKKTLISHRWIFRRKSNGSAKARVVARGFGQKAYRDFDPVQVASPVALTSMFRMLIAIAVFFGLSILSLDYSTAYLNSVLTDIIFMSIPEGYLERFHPSLDPNLCCIRLRKSIYGLKQSAFLWHSTLCSALVSIGYQATLEPCVFFRFTDGIVSLVGWHVDDLLCVCSPSIRDSESAKLAALFKSSAPIHNPATFLHWSLEYSDDGVKLSMSSYIRRLALNQTATMLPCSSPFALPLAPRTTSEAADKTLFQTLVGQITYVAYCGRPDLAFCASALAVHSSDPSVDHLAAAQRALRYILSTPDLGLLYRHNGSPIEQALSAYSDSDWACDAATRKSQSGNIILFDKNIIDWSSKRQSIVATSTQEAELTAALTATSTTLFFRDFLEMIHLNQQTTSLYLDNKSGIDACNTLTQPKAKHIAIRLAFLRDAVQKHLVRVSYVSTYEQIADCLTKPSGGLKFQKHCQQLGMT